MDRSGGVTYVLEASVPGVLPVTFVLGSPVGPFSVGRAGQWRFDGPGVLDVHGAIAFDGAIVFFRSEIASHPVVVEGRALGQEWVAIAPPCRIVLGSVEVMFRVLGSDGVPGAFTTASARPTKVTFAGDNERTRVGVALSDLRDLAPPAPSPSASQAPPATVASSQIPPATGSSVSQVPSATGRSASQAPSAAVQVSAPPAPAPTLPWAPAHGPSSRARVKGSNRTVMRVVAAALLVLSVVFGIVVRGRSKRGGAPPPPSLEWPEASASPNVGVAVFPAPVLPEPSEQADAGVSLDRIAVDAVHRGDLAAAATAYEELAAQHPENPAYARAAKTLKR